MSFIDFTKQMVSMEEICRDLYRRNRRSIKIKKEEVVIKNLVTIFNATLELSNQKGFHAMSLRDLCRETELSMGALYSYFTSKDELVDIIQNQGRQVVMKVLLEQIARGSTPREKLHIAIRTHLYLSEVMKQWFYFSFMETKNLSKEEQRKSIESELFTEKIFIDILEDGNREKCFEVQDSVLTGSLIKAMLQDWYLKRWKYSKRNITVDEYAEFIIRLIETFITPSENK
jgi:AcrR family transcriptional regulator